MAQTEQIILLHGIARSSKHMRSMGNYLRKNGFIIHNIDYPSTRYPLEILRDIIWESVEASIDPGLPVHFVGYSMGGLLTRAMLTSYRPAHLGRVVLLAAPNKGSEVADFLQHNWLYKKIYGPAGAQLITQQDAIAHLFGAVDYEMGVIAGNLVLDPICGYIIGQKSDGKVSIESTKHEGMKDFTTVKSSHTWFPQNKQVQRQTKAFIQNGQFSHA